MDHLLDRALREEERCRDRGVVLALGHLAQDVALARGQLVERRRQVLALCAGGADQAKWANGGRPTPGPTARCFSQIDRTIGSALALLGSATQLDFTPAPDEAVRYREIERIYPSLKKVIGQIVASSSTSLGPHARAENLAIGLETRATALAEATTLKTDALIAVNDASYRSSRNLLIAVAAGAFALAVLLGLILSSSLVVTRRHSSGRSGGPRRG